MCELEFTTKYRYERHLTSGRHKSLAAVFHSASGATTPIDSVSGEGCIDIFSGLTTNLDEFDQVG